MNALTFNTFPPQILFQEVPDEVSLAYTVYGCPIQCRGCHSRDSWDLNGGAFLSAEMFSMHLKRYQSMVTCVLFFGGEWHPDALIAKLKIARQKGLKTCLYTGADRVPLRIQNNLTYLKTGPWQPKRGGLQSKTTNQKFLELASGNLLNYKFQEQQNAAA